MGSLLQTCALLERRVKAAAQEGKTVFHPELRQIRTELRQACEGALFEDYPRAQVMVQERLQRGCDLSRCEPTVGLQLLA